MGELEVTGIPKESFPGTMTTHLSDLQTCTEGLKFSNVCVDAAGKRILWSISGHASPGHVLAVMGPSGSGKTTLLNILAGYMDLSSGLITLDGSKLGKRTKRKISYVLQADIFFPNLTLRETLRYSALLRLPREYSFKEKLAKVEEIISSLHLSDCANTIIGDALVRGLSGGEKKRANIGCELLTNPSLLLLDEPTSGLDSSSALTLMQNLCRLAKDEGKIVVASIHQPSSQLYHMFDDLLLLAKGKVAYFGETSGALPYFSSQGLQCTVHYNPADFMLEMVTQDESRKTLIGEDPIQSSQPLTRIWWKRILCWRKCHEKKESSMTIDLEAYPSSPKFPRRALPTVAEDDKDMTLETSASDSDTPLDSKGDYCDVSSVGTTSRKWPTFWHWQLLVLIVRTFRQSRHVILSKLDFLQTIFIAIMVSFFWFQIPEDEESINDRRGYFFFTLTYWAFQPLIVSSLSFPSEHLVISKERRSGSYHLSAYYFAKTLSEMPLVLLFPSLYYIITYWCGGFNGWASFFGTWFILLTSSVISQGLGLMIGALFMNFTRSLVAAAVIMLSFMLLGGYFVQRLPYWLFWAKYASFVSYLFDAMQEFSFCDLNFRCSNSSMSQYESCTVGNATTISGKEVFLQHRPTFGMWYWNTLIALGYGILFRCIAYLALRFLHRKH